MSLLSQELLLPIIPTNLSFFHDSFFDQTRRYFEMAVKEIIDRCGLSSTDHLSSYRQLRQNDLRTENRAISVTDQQSERKITVDVKDFKDGDLKVKTLGHDITVEGKVQVKKEGSTSNQTFRRRFTLPDIVDMESVTATVSSDGILTITAPKKNLVQQQSTTRDLLNDVCTSQQKLTSLGISPKPFGSCPPHTFVHRNNLENSQESCVNGERNHKISTDSSSPVNVTHQKDSEKDRQRGRDIKIRPMTPLPIMIRGSFYEDSFFRSAQSDFEVALNRILRKFDIDYSSDNFFNKYRTLRNKNFTDETQAVNLSEDNSNHKIVLDVQDFKDGNVQVKAVGQILVVEGRTEKLTNGSRSTHTFRRQFSMPQDAKLTDVTAALSSDGILTILAKKVSKSRESKEIFIPIEVTDRFDKQKNQESVTNGKTNKLTREITIDNWQQTKPANQKIEKSKNEHIIPIEVEGTDTKHLHEHQILRQQQQQVLLEQQEKLLQQEKQIQEQLQTLSEQEESLRQQQRDIDRQRQNYRKLQRRVRVEQLVPRSRSNSHSPPKTEESPAIEKVLKSLTKEGYEEFPIIEKVVQSHARETVDKSRIIEKISKSHVREDVDKSPIIEKIDKSPTPLESHHSRGHVLKNIDISTTMPHTWQPTGTQIHQSTIQQNTSQLLSAQESEQSQVTLDSCQSYQTPAAEEKYPSTAVHHTWQPSVPQMYQATVQQPSVRKNTARSPVTNGLCVSPVDQEECLSHESPSETPDVKSSEQTPEPQFFRSRFNRQNHFDRDSMNIGTNSQGSNNECFSDQESYRQTSQEEDSSLLESRDSTIIDSHHNNARSSRFVPIRTDSTISSISTISEDLTNDAEIETIKNQHSSGRSRVLPIRMESTLSSVSSLSEDLTNDSEVANILQKSRNTTSDTNKTLSSETDFLTNGISLHNPLKMTMKDFSFPIERRGSFFQDSFFNNHQKLFQSAISKVLDDFGIGSTFDDLTAYRTLRRSVSSEASQAAEISEEEKEYKVVLDVHDFVGGEVRIRAEGQILVVEGRTQKNERNSTSSQSFRRCFNFPTSVDMEAVSSALSSDGVLTVIAPKSDHFSIVEVDDSGEVKEGSQPSTQTKQGGSTCTRSSRSTTKTVGGWKEQSSFHETSFADGVNQETSTKTFQSSSTSGKLI
ncbi:uncharacterized protein LOC143037537 [Oratosquilla oratoria]|uniref:uncharacterized protein LOC143037537 n=1 Tax=Oratosquilla oratoria TaxID=337810 RepID=UPI003F75D639